MQKTVTIAGYTFRASQFKDAESYARTVFVDTLATFGPGDVKTRKALRDWAKVQKLNN